MQHLHYEVIEVGGETNINDEIIGAIAGINEVTDEVIGGLP
jgi:hypothetical protein